MGRPRIDFPINLGGPLTFANNITIKGNMTLAGNVALTGANTIFSGPGQVQFNTINGTVFNSQIQAAGGLFFISVHGAQTPLNNNIRGTWTPTLQGAGGTAGAYAALAAVGTYYEIGNLVVASFNIQLTNAGSWTGQVQIAGLPEFADAVGPNNQGGFITHISGLAGMPANANTLELLVVKGTKIAILNQITNGSDGNLDYVTNINGSVSISGTLIYQMGSTID